MGTTFSLRFAAINRATNTAATVTRLITVGAPCPTGQTLCSGVCTSVPCSTFSALTSLGAGSSSLLSAAKTTPTFTFLYQKLQLQDAANAAANGGRGYGPTQVNFTAGLTPDVLALQVLPSSASTPDSSSSGHRHLLRVTPPLRQFRSDNDGDGDGLAQKLVVLREWYSQQRQLQVGPTTAAAHVGDDDDSETASRAAELASVEAEVQGLRDGKQLSAALAWLGRFLAAEQQQPLAAGADTAGQLSQYAGDDSDFLLNSLRSDGCLEGQPCTADHPGAVLQQAPVRHHQRARILQASAATSSGSSPNVSLPFGGLIPPGAPIEVGFVSLSPCPNATLSGCGVSALDYQVGDDHDFSCTCIAFLPSPA